MGKLFLKNQFFPPFPYECEAKILCSRLLVKKILNSKIPKIHVVNENSYVKKRESIISLSRFVQKILSYSSIPGLSHKSSEKWRKIFLFFIRKGC